MICIDRSYWTDGGDGGKAVGYGVGVGTQCRTVGGVVTETEIEDQIKRNKPRTVSLDNSSRHLTLMDKN
jgi:hypothetical protein